jgi:protease-4
MKAREAILFLAILAVVLFAIAAAMSLLLPSSGFLGKGVAVVPIKEELFNDTAETFIEHMDRAASDISVAAIVLDIDSGGGAVVPTKRMVAKIKEVKEEHNKPVVAYIGGIGASGAYYVAAASDHILADEDSITASLGAIWIFTDINTMLSRIGINVTEIKAGENKAIGSPFHEMTAEEEEILRGITQETFVRFRNAIIELRGGKLNSAHYGTIFDGRVLSGATALKYGLVDETGTLDDAISKAGSLAGIEGKPRTFYYRESKLVFGDLFEVAGSAFASGLLNNSSGTAPLYYR